MSQQQMHFEESMQPREGTYQGGYENVHHSEPIIGSAYQKISDQPYESTIRHAEPVSGSAHQQNTNQVSDKALIVKYRGRMALMSLLFLMIMTAFIGIQLSSTAYLGVNYPLLFILALFYIITIFLNILISRNHK